MGLGARVELSGVQVCVARGKRVAKGSADATAECTSVGAAPGGIGKAPCDRKPRTYVANQFVFEAPVYRQHGAFIDSNGPLPRFFELAPP